jgi:dTDP-4-amino-4,6-dideoxygalactose transaminase
VLDERVRQRRVNFEFYKTHLGKVQGITFCSEAPGTFSNRWLTTILVDPTTTGITREQLRIALEKENVESRPLWKPMHLQPVFKNVSAFIYENGSSARLFANGLCLPSSSNLSERNKSFILEVISANLIQITGQRFSKA